MNMPGPAMGPIVGKRVMVAPGEGPEALLDHLRLPTGKSQVIALPGDAQEVLVGDPQIADVSISTPRRISIIGRKAGETNVYVLGPGGRDLARLEISVGPDAGVVQAALGRALPGLPA